MTTTVRRLMLTKAKKERKVDKTEQQIANFYGTTSTA